MNMNENMNALSSSTVAVRKSRGDWLTPKKSGIYFRTALRIFVALALSASITAVIVLSMKLSKLQKNNNTFLVDIARYNSMLTNSDIEQNINGPNAEIPAHMYGKSLEKVGQRICELKPESRNELGRSTWAFLHILASTYPINPTPETVQDHKLFFQLLPRIYPCPDCRTHMAKMFQDLPPRLQNRDEFVHWLCEAHNRVNERLGKPVFDCSKHDDRWDCGCGIVPGQPLGENNNPPTAPETNNRESKSRKSTKKDSKSHKSQNLHKKQHDAHSKMQKNA